MHVFARHISIPKGFVERAEGFSPTVSVTRNQTTAGLKPSACITKTAYAAYLQNAASHPYRHQGLQYCPIKRILAQVTITL